MLETRHAKLANPMTNLKDYGLSLFIISGISGEALPAIPDLGTGVTRSYLIKTRQTLALSNMPLISSCFLPDTLALHGSAMTGSHTSGSTPGDDPMAFDDVKAEIGLLLTRMQNEPEDAHELYLQLMERLNELKAYGLPIPDDLQALEAALAADFDEERGPAPG